MKTTIYLLLLMCACIFGCEFFGMLAKEYIGWAFIAAANCCGVLAVIAALFSIGYGAGLIIERFTEGGDL